ncbi:phage minor tail protein [Escherichia coli]|nr:phage minor tail protein [Escherichia coli]
MQDIRQETLNECTRAEQSASVVLWEIDLTEVGGERYFFCNEQNEKGEPVTWQGRQYQPYPIQGSGFELNGKGTSTRPTLTVSNLYGMVTGMAEDMQSLVGGTVVRRKVYARFLDAVNFVNGNSYADPEQEVISRWRIEQCSELSAVMQIEQEVLTTWPADAIARAEDVVLRLSGMSGPVHVDTDITEVAKNNALTDDDFSAGKSSTAS